ncbi:acyl-CoA N-acyltransferase [Polychaeton citri CBS 116435]|uniref:Acyl-CoA N-acyltransferase n=1 Tax=Polychaeton citri CBS 116435 TaxID=1314669 RepID=A0A9P4URY0_9PEZI|nr:acyl-CoA N-acyltransferase [Polychaeton citri CBS 116435]
MASACTIETERLLIRPLCEEDLEAFHRLQSDPQVTQFTKQGPNKDITKSQEILDDCLVEMNASDSAELVLILAIIVKPVVASSGLVGLVGTFRPREIGFSLHPTSWGRGLAREAVDAFARWFKSSFPDEQLFAKVSAENRASVKVCQGCGFTKATDQEVRSDLRLQVDSIRETWLCRL